jgi:parallel beta-helix repeat protein
MDCGTVISQPGRYFLLNDLKQCPDFGVSIAASKVELELRDHTIQTMPASGGPINANGETTGLIDIEIEGPGTLTGGFAGILFQNVHHSRVTNLVVVGNAVGIEVAGSIVVSGNTIGTVVKAADLRRVQTVAGTGSTDNEFRDNVVADQTLAGVAVIDGNHNHFIHNNLSGNLGLGLFLISGNKNTARHNTVDANGSIGIFAFGSENIFDDNTAVGNFPTDLEDGNGVCANTWTDNSFNSASPDCIH